MTIPLILICTAEEINSRTTTLSHFFEAGLETLHLRSKILKKEPFRRIIASIPAAFHSRIVIHTHYSLFSEFGLKGIHLTEYTKKLPEYTSLPSSPPISASFHSLQELEAETRPFRYVFVSPVFASISKPGLQPSFSKDELKSFLTWRKTGSLPVVALGGIQASNLSQVQSLGFAGAAVCGAVWKANAPLEAFRLLTCILKTSCLPNDQTG